MIKKEMIEQLEALTPEEQAKPYSKYYYHSPAAPDAEVLGALQYGTQMDPSKATMSEHMNELLHPGYVEVENGYCQLPDGGGYFAVHTKMPGITMEMSKWFHSWHELEDINYKIWMPKAHYKADVELGWILEDIGEGPAQIVKIGGGSPEQMGFDEALFLQSKVVMGASSALYMLYDVPVGQVPLPIVICHLIREMPGGIEYRSRFWLGYQSGYHGMKLKLRPGVIVPESTIQHLAMHCASELANLRAFLPSLYEEMVEKENR